MPPHAAVSHTFSDKKVLMRGEDIYLCLSIDGTFTECFELQNFPFDIQPLTISIAVNCRASGPLAIKLCCTDATTAYGVQEEDFHLRSIYRPRKNCFVVTGETGQDDRVFPAVNVISVLERRPQHTVTNIFVPMFIFVLLACVVSILPTYALAPPSFPSVGAHAGSATGRLFSATRRAKRRSTHIKETVCL